MRIGLTGNIATGKSQVASIFQQLGCTVIDADQIARKVVEPGRPAYHQIVDEFGGHILASDHTIDRAKLGNLVFRDAKKRGRLNQILHPRVMAEIERLLTTYEKSDPSNPVIVEGALIIEIGVQGLFDRLVVVYCPPQQQLKRLLARDGISREQALDRMNSQLSWQEKRKHADFEVNTSGSFEQTRDQVQRIYQQLQSEIKTGLHRQTQTM